MSFHMCHPHHLCGRCGGTHSVGEGLGVACWADWNLGRLEVGWRAVAQECSVRVCVCRVPLESQRAVLKSAPAFLSPRGSGRLHLCRVPGEAGAGRATWHRAEVVKWEGAVRARWRLRQQGGISGRFWGAGEGTEACGGVATQPSVLSCPVCGTEVGALGALTLQGRTWGLWSHHPRTEMGKLRHREMTSACLGPLGVAGTSRPLQQMLDWGRGRWRFVGRGDTPCRWSRAWGPCSVTWPGLLWAELPGTRAPWLAGEK